MGVGGGGGSALGGCGFGGGGLGGCGLGGSGCGGTGGSGVGGGGTNCTTTVGGSILCWCASSTPLSANASSRACSDKAMVAASVEVRDIIDTPS